jgi:hypothetical protein
VGVVAVGVWIMNFLDQVLVQIGTLRARTFSRPRGHHGMRRESRRAGNLDRLIS